MRIHQLWNNKRVTDLKTCRRIEIPEPREESINGTPVEVVLANINSRAENFTKQYISKNCDKNGYPNAQKSAEQASIVKGIKSIQKKVKNNQLFLTTSDKTGKMVANTRENYIDRMETHVSNDRVINWEEKESIEKTLNGHSIQMGRLLKIGEKHGHEA